MYKKTTIVCFHSACNKRNNGYSHKRINAIKLEVPKRSMQSLTALRNALFHRPRKFTRGFATWNTTMRKEEPIKGQAPEMEIDADTGLEIMNPIDYSGQNHILLHQKDYKSETFFLIRGSFTTSLSPFLGKKPIEVAKSTLEGKPQTQYLHVYDEPKLIRISDTIGMDFTTMFLPPNEEIDALIRQFSLAGLEIKK